MAGSQGELPESFFQLLVESTKVEALIGLRDAMAPENLVPLPGHAAGPSGQPQAQSASSSAEDVLGEPDEQEDSKAGGTSGTLNAFGLLSEV